MSEPFDPYYKWLGIPPAEQPPNHYRLLGLNLFETDLEVISNAADQRMVHLRVYQTGKQSATSQRLLNEISTARVTLLDAARKAAYDESLRAALAAQSDALVLTEAPPGVEDAASVPPTPEALAAAETELQKRLAACNELQRNYNALRNQSWLAKAAVVEAAAVLRFRAVVAGFPGGRIGLFAVILLTGFGLGVIGMAIVSPSGLLVLFGAMMGAAFFAALGRPCALPAERRGPAPLAAETARDGGRRARAIAGAQNRTGRRPPPAGRCPAAPRPPGRGVGAADGSWDSDRGKSLHLKSRDHA